MATRPLLISASCWNTVATHSIREAATRRVYSVGIREADAEELRAAILSAAR
jgi:hypothetical protein